MRVALSWLVPSLILIVAFSGCIGGDAPGSAGSPAGSQSTAPSTDSAASPTDSSPPNPSDSPEPSAEPSEEPANTPPTANLTAEVAEGAAPLTVNFTITGTDADGDNLSYSLDADGDGNEDANGSAFPASISFTYVNPGNYTATLNVTDGTVAVSATASISVIQAGPCGTQPEPCKLDENLWVEFWSDGLCHAKGEIDQGGFYVHDRAGAGQPQGTGYVTGQGTWLYEESNGVAGLQIGGQSDLVGDLDAEPPEYDNCVNPDTLLF